MDIYAIVQKNTVETRRTLSEITALAKKYAKDSGEAKVLKNGKEIGWIGQDLSKRLGWGFFIKAD